MGVVLIFAMRNARRNGQKPPCVNSGYAPGYTCSLTEPSFNYLTSLARGTTHLNNKLEALYNLTSITHTWSHLHMQQLHLSLVHIHLKNTYVPLERNLQLIVPSQWYILVLITSAWQNHLVLSKKIGQSRGV